MFVVVVVVEVVAVEVDGVAVLGTNSKIAIRSASGLLVSSSAPTVLNLVGDRPRDELLPVADRSLDDLILLPLFLAVVFLGAGCERVVLVFLLVLESDSRDSRACPRGRRTGLSVVCL